MKKTIELLFKAYKEKESTIERGWISEENAIWVSECLMLKYLTDEGLSQIWQAVHDFFRNEMAELNENNEVINWKPNKSFEMDTQSAWLEVINEEARKRKAAKNK